MKPQFINRIVLSKSARNHSILWHGLVLAAAVLLWFAFSPRAEAADGGLPGGNTAEGDNALQSLTTGTGNTAIGNSALFTDSIGNDNTASGLYALYHNRSGRQNTADGVQALFNNNGINNTAVGWNALINNGGAHDNTAVGSMSLDANTVGIQNTAIGSTALFTNQGGNNNLAAGWRALYNNMNGSSNVAVGVNALYHNSSGVENVANGGNALFGNTVGHLNTAIGHDALETNSSVNVSTASGHGALQKNEGDDNVAVGANALSSAKFVTGSTAVGEGALVNSVSSGNTALGILAGSNLTIGSFNTYIDNQGVAGDSGTIRIGTAGTQKFTFVAGIYNENEGGTIKPVYVNSNGQLGTQPPASSARFKDQIKPMDQTSEAILGLKPVTFRYKSDSAGTPQFGLIAEEAAKADPNPVVLDDSGEIYTVRYDAVNAMLLNEFLKAHHRLEEQDCNLKAQAAAISLQRQQIEALAASLEKVSDQVQASQPTLVAGNQD